MPGSSGEATSVAILGPRWQSQSPMQAPSGPPAAIQRPHRRLLHVVLRVCFPGRVSRRTDTEGPAAAAASGMENVKNIKMPAGGPAAGKLARVLLLGGAAVYGLTNCLFNVEGGHRWVPAAPGWADLRGWRPATRRRRRQSMSTMRAASPALCSGSAHPARDKQLPNST